MASTGVFNAVAKFMNLVTNMTCVVGRKFQIAGREMKMVRRAIEIEGTGIVLELSKAAGVRTNKNMIHLDQLPDGTWRLIYNSKMIPDFSKITALKMIRIDGE